MGASQSSHRLPADSQVFSQDDKQPQQTNLPPPYHTEPLEGQTRTSALLGSDTVVFVYEGRKCAVRRPLSYQDAVMLVQSQVVSFDQTDSEVRFLARVPLLDEAEDVEITPSAWNSLTAGISRFQVVIVDLQTQPINGTAAPPKYGLLPAAELSLRIWYQGSERFKIVVKPNDSFGTLKQKIQKQLPALAIDDQFLVLYRPRRHIDPHDDETFSQHRVKSGETIRVYSKSSIKESRRTRSANRGSEPN